MRKTSVFQPFKNLAKGAAAVIMAGLLTAPALAGFTLSDDFGGEPMPLSGVRPLSLPLGFEYEFPPFEEGTPAPYTETVTPFLGGAVIIGDGSIEDLDVMIRMRHPNPTDLQIFLRHWGDEIEVVHLMAWGTGCSENDMPSSARFNQDIFLYLDDQAPSDINSACTRSIPSLDGRFFPTLTIDGEQSNQLSSLNGRGINSGAFDLIIRDYGPDGSPQGEIIDWALVFNNPIDGDVAPREMAPTSSPIQSGNNILTEQDYVVSAFHLLGYNTLDDRVKSGRFYGYGEDGEGELAPRGFLGLFDNLAEYKDRDPRDIAEFEAVRRSSPTEFLRMDSAPASSGGDGIISVADFVQTARYVASLDELQPSLGPLSRYDRTVTAVTYAEDPEDPEKLILSPGLFRGQSEPTKVSVIMRSSNSETEVGFGLEFDPELLELVDVVKGPAIPENSIFQVDRNVDVDPGLVGLRVGVMPDDTFAALPLPKPVLSTRVFKDGEWKWREVINTKVDSSATAPALFEAYSLSTDYKLSFDDPDAPRAEIQFNVENNSGIPAYGFVFDILVDEAKLAFEEVDGASINELFSTTPGYKRYQVAGGVDTFEDQPIATATFRVITGATDAPSPNIPSVRLLRNRSIPQVFIPQGVPENLAVLYSTTLDDSRTGGRGLEGNILYPDADADTINRGTVLEFQSDPIDDDIVTVRLNAEKGVQTITRFIGNLEYARADFEFVSFASADFSTGSEGGGNTEDEDGEENGNSNATGDTAGLEPVNLPGGMKRLALDLDADQGMLNGTIFEIQFRRLNESAVGPLTLKRAATRNRFLYTGGDGSVEVTEFYENRGTVALHVGGALWTEFAMDFPEDQPPRVGVDFYGQVPTTVGINDYAFDVLLGRVVI